MNDEGGEILVDHRRVAFTVVRSKRRRRSIAFEMENPERLKVTAPQRASFGAIQSVLRRHAGWIRRRIDQLLKPSVVRLPDYHNGAAFTYLGHACKLDVTHDAARPQGCRLLPRRLIVNLHGTSDGADLKEEIRLEILLWLKKRAKAKFRRRLDLWAARLGVPYKDSIVANAGRRWGSCNGENVIRLNWRLILAPLPLLDYVAVHELCHVRNKNHGPGFWRQVNSVMPDYRQLRRQLHAIDAGFDL